MIRRFVLGDRVAMIDHDGTRLRGEQGVITREVHPAVLTGRPMVEVLFDGERAGFDDEGVYVQSIEHVRLQAVA